MIDLTQTDIPPGQQVVARDKWPIIGEREPRESNEPWNLKLSGLSGKDQKFSLADLNSLSQTTLKMDIHCVTRWTRQAVTFAGVLLADLLRQFNPPAAGKFVSFVSRSDRNHSTSLPLDIALTQQTLIALKVDGLVLPSEHGGPIRNVVPGRYFYKSVKWLERIDILDEDRLGFWEAETGYHNNADPWREQRYMAPTIDRRTAIGLIASLDFSGRDLRSIDASHRDLRQLKAAGSFLRDANFRKSNLSGADFTDANLSNAHFQQSNLRGVRFLRTDLEGANLSGADLRNADLTGASLIGCSFVEECDGGQPLSAIIDSTTILSGSQLEPLTAAQADFVSSRKR